jgi:purine-cytosine permease-like protein
LATLPIIQLAFDFAMPANTSSASTLVVNIVVFLVISILVSVDSTNLKRLGYKVPIWMGIVLVPLYLFRRSKETHQSQVGFYVWLGGFALSFVLALSGGIGSIGHSASYETGRQAGANAAADQWNSLFGSIENSCAYKADYYSWTNYDEFIQGCVDEYNAQTNG